MLRFILAQFVRCLGMLAVTVVIALFVLDKIPVITFLILCVAAWALYDLHELIEEW